MDIYDIDTTFNECHDRLCRKAVENIRDAHDAAAAKIVLAVTLGEVAALSHVHKTMVRRMAKLEGDIRKKLESFRA